MNETMTLLIVSARSRCASASAAGSAMRKRTCGTENRVRAEYSALIPLKRRSVASHSNTVRRQPARGHQRSRSGS